MREDVRLLRTRLEVAPEGRRVAVDLELTPFVERPTIEGRLFNGSGESAGLINMIETLDTVNRVVMHLRDSETINPYRLELRIYYAHIEQDMKRMMVDEVIQTFEVTPGNVVLWEGDEGRE